METKRQLKEERRQTYLKSNQLNVNLIKKLNKLPNGEIIIAIYAGKNSKVVTDKRDYKINQVFLNNEFLRFIDFKDAKK